jgi:hypothetical protein
LGDWESRGSFHRGGGRGRLAWECDKGFTTGSPTPTTPHALSTATENGRPEREDDLPEVPGLSRILTSEPGSHPTLQSPQLLGPAARTTLAPEGSSTGVKLRLRQGPGRGELCPAWGHGA